MSHDLTSPPQPLAWELRPPRSSPHALSSLSEPLSIDVRYGGVGQISGITKKEGLPASLLVVLFERESMQPIRRTVSAANGAYSFTRLDPSKKYLTVCRELGTPEKDAQAHDYIEATL